MVVIPDRASQRNNFEIIPLSRPRIERAVDCDGFYVLRDDHGWLCGDRRQAMNAPARAEAATASVCRQPLATGDHGHEIVLTPRACGTGEALAGRRSRPR